MLGATPRLAWTLPLLWRRCCVLRLLFFCDVLAAAAAAKSGLSLSSLFLLPLALPEEAAVVKNPVRVAVRTCVVVVAAEWWPPLLLLLVLVAAAVVVAVGLKPKRSKHGKSVTEAR